MIGKIKRMVAGSSYDAKAWDVNQQLELETDVDSTFPTEEEPLSPSPEAAVEPVTVTTHGGTDYYASLIRASIDRGGKFGDHRISIRWLRMTLAGLEGRSIKPEATWEDPGYQELALEGETGANPEFPSFTDLFRTDEVPSGPELAE